MFCVVWDYSNSKQKATQYKQKILPQSYKTEIKIIRNSSLVLSGFEQSSPDAYAWLCYKQ